MKGWRLAAAACAVLVSSTAGAQTPAGDKPAQPEMMLTGCLRSSGADTAVAGPSGRLYTLEVLETVRPAGTAPDAPPPAPTKTTYSLALAPGLELEKHADHEVQLTGRLQAPSTARSDRAGAPGAPGSSPQKPTPGGGHRTFQVSAVKMVSASCR